MPTQNLLYKDAIHIADGISIVIPTVGQVLDDEDGYNTVVNALTAMPIDMMVELDDAGIDFSEINAFELFILMFGSIRSMDTSRVFGDLDLNKFQIADTSERKEIYLVDPESGTTIDRAVHTRIANAMRMLHNKEKDRRRPANKEAKEYMIKRAREKRNRRRDRDESSQLESLIVAMVSTSEFKYNFEQVKNMSIYQFNESVAQIIHKIGCEHRLNGVYAGTLDLKSIDQKDLNWLSHK